VAPSKQRDGRDKGNLVRVDGEGKVSGNARYAADIQLPGLLVGRTLRLDGRNQKRKTLDADWP